MRVVALLALIFSASGCLDVDALDGTIICSAVTGRECPRGYYCLQPNNTCWRNGHAPVDMARPRPPVDLAVPRDDLSAQVGPADMAQTD
jgi:hypothetical protein